MFGSGLFLFGFIRLDFLILISNHCEYCPFCGEVLFLLFSVIFVNDVCLSIYVFVFCHSKLVVLGPWEFVWRAGSYILVCVTPLCGVPGRYNFI